MMAGLFNYEIAYRRYTRQLLDSFRDENIQYAEIRPNFMQKNQVITCNRPVIVASGFLLTILRAPGLQKGGSNGSDE